MPKKNSDLIDETAVTLLNQINQMATTTQTVTGLQALANAFSTVVSAIGNEPKERSGKVY